MTVALMLSPIPARSYNANGNVYVADQYGILAGVSYADIATLISAGCLQLFPTGAISPLGVLKGANLNSTGDQAIVMPSTKFRVTRVVVAGVSRTMSTAAGGIYTFTGKGGAQIVQSTQSYNGFTTSAAYDLTIYSPAVNIVNPASNTLYLSLTTAEGTATTADIYVYGDIYG